MADVTTAAGAEAWTGPPTPPLLAQLVDDTTLLRPKATAPGPDATVTRYLAARAGRYGGLVGRMVCPVSRLPVLVAELARAAPGQPVELSLVVDTGLGGLPKALSTVASRASLLALRTIETAAPPDVDGVWLERVSEFVPEDVVAVVEPRRPHTGEPAQLDAWLAAVRRVAEHGCALKLRCGGPRDSDVPSSAHVERFLRVAVDVGRPCAVQGVADLVRGPAGRPGILNVLLATARVQGGGDVAVALDTDDAAELAAELAKLPERAVKDVRTTVTCCGLDLDPVPVAQLAALGLLA